MDGLQLADSGEKVIQRTVLIFVWDTPSEFVPAFRVGDSARRLPPKRRVIEILGRWDCLHRLSEAVGDGLGKPPKVVLLLDDQQSLGRREKFHSPAAVAAKLENEVIKQLRLRARRIIHVAIMPTAGPHQLLSTRH